MHRMKQAHAGEAPNAPRFHCPVCGYRGVFVDAPGPTGPRKYGRCPHCGAYERHRLQAKVLQSVLGDFAPETKSALHFSPEPGLAATLRERFGVYKTADLVDGHVDYRCDLRSLPFDDASYDFVFASHVLEHIAEDRLAIAQIYRILKPGGIALLPVPIVCDTTVEYPYPVDSEDGHVRAPGPDYFDRYREVFDRVVVPTSRDVDGDSQPFIYEDRTTVPNGIMPFRQPMTGHRHPDYVPVCLKGPGQRMPGAALFCGL
jgi:hypothetical protein